MAFATFRGIDTACVLDALSVGCCHGVDPLLLFGEVVGCFGDAFELCFALQIQEDSSFFDETALKHPFDDLIAVKCKNLNKGLLKGLF